MHQKSTGILSTGLGCQQSWRSMSLNVTYAWLIVQHPAGNQSNNANSRHILGVRLVLTSVISMVIYYWLSATITATSLRLKMSPEPTRMELSKPWRQCSLATEYQTFLFHIMALSFHRPNLPLSWISGISSTPSHLPTTLNQMGKPRMQWRRSNGYSLSAVKLVSQNS